MKPINFTLAGIFAFVLPIVGEFLCLLIPSWRPAIGPASLASILIGCAFIWRA